MYTTMQYFSWFVSTCSCWRRYFVTPLNLLVFWVSVWIRYLKYDEVKERQLKLTGLSSCNLAIAASLTVQYRSMSLSLKPLRQGTESSWRSWREPIFFQLDQIMAQCFHARGLVLLLLIYQQNHFAVLRFVLYYYSTLLKSLSPCWLWVFAINK